jgi:hypothetical protein
MKRKFEVVKTVIWVGTVVSVLVSCTRSPEWIKSQRDKVKVALVASNSGFKLLSINGLPTLSIVDYDGMKIKRIWTPKEAQPGKLDTIMSCIKKRSHEDSDQVQLLREVAAICARESGFLSPSESKQESPDGFEVYLSVIADPMSSGSGQSFSKTSEHNLGAHFQINRPGIRYEHTFLNINQCVDKAAEQGVLQFISSGQSEQSGFIVEGKFQSIEPFLDRFTNCVQEFGYSTD